MNENEKRFVVKKFIMATSATDAINLDKKTPVDEVYLDPEWDKENVKIGFAERKKKNG